MSADLHYKANIASAAQDASVTRGVTIQGDSLRESVERAMTNYFNNLNGQDVTDVYNLVLSEVEAPLLETVLQYVRGNQTRAATLLGLNRGTLRKKLKLYGLL